MKYESLKNVQNMYIVFFQQKQPVVVLEPLAIIDHTYCQKPLPSPVEETPPPALEDKKKKKSDASILAETTNKLEIKEEKEKEKKEEKQRQKEEKKKARKRKNELAKILDEEVVIPEPKAPQFMPRNYYQEWTLLYEFLRTGIDHEDAYLIRKSYETLLEAGRIPWLSYTHWVPHSHILSIITDYAVYNFYSNHPSIYIGITKNYFPP